MEHVVCIRLGGHSGEHRLRLSAWTCDGAVHGGQPYSSTDCLPNLNPEPCALNPETDGVVRKSGNDAHYTRFAEGGGVYAHS